MASDREELMPFSVETNVFATEDEATALLEARGCAVIAADVEDVERGLHWHDFDAVIAVVEGSLMVEDAAGREYSCGPGSVLEATDRVLHTERTEAGRFVYGFPGGLPDFSAGINLDPSDHPGAS